MSGDRKAADETGGPGAGDRITVSALLPVHVDRPEYRRALAALAAADPPFDEVIVACDGPATGAAAAARAHGFGVTTGRAEPAGPAAARNDAARVATGDVLLFVDADVAVHADIVGRLRAALSATVVDAVVGVYDDQPPAPNFFSRYKNLLQRYVHLDARPDGATFWGACGAVRRSALAAVGGFDERFRHPSVEDIDLGYRLTKAGYRIAFRHDVQVTHLKTWTLATLVRSDVLRRAVPWTWLLMRESSIRPDLNLRRRHRLAGATACALWLSLPMVPVFRSAAVVSACSACLLVLVDRGLWGFFRSNRGTGFATAGMVWHWVYYAYSTLAFAAGVGLYPLVGRRLVGDDGRRPSLEPVSQAEPRVRAIGG